MRATDAEVEDRPRIGEDRPVAARREGGSAARQPAPQPPLPTGKTVRLLLIAEPAILRLLFYPRYEPRFEVEATLRYINNIGQSHTVTKVKVSASITNKGNASAYEPCIIAALQRGANGLPTPWLLNASGWHRISMEPSRLMITGSVPLHPDFPLTFMGSNDWNAPQRSIGRRLLPKFDPFAIEFSVYSRDSSKKILTVEFSEDDLLNSDTCNKICK